jgi:POT family proton-dependent oligopeptide transporter
MVNLCGSVLSSIVFGKWFKITMQSWKIAGGISLYILLLCHYILDGKARHQLMADNLIVFTIVFWALFEQAYTSMNLFADRILDRTVFGYEVSAGQF